MKKSVKILLYSLVSITILASTTIVTIMVLRSVHDSHQEPAQSTNNSDKKASDLEKEADSLLNTGNYVQSKKKLEDARDIYNEAGDQEKSSSLQDTIETVNNLNNASRSEPKQTPAVSPND